MSERAMAIGRRGFLGCAAAIATAAGISRASFAQVDRGALLAPTPPMGWNSWNSFATTITEAQAIETARIMAAKLLPFGYDVFTVDIQWYEPDASSYTYNKNPVPEMDGYGRLVPAPNRFPSSAGAKGFAPLAAQVHALGLKFGIHLMRGIPRLAVERNLPVFGTSVRAADIADRSSICDWNPDMYGVDMTKPGAQAYYDSVFALYASWGVDFIKMDDMSRPYGPHRAEIEAAHKAILAAGRPIILSLSPGETPVEEGPHVSAHAQMWRISDDFWDEWPMLRAQFDRLERWTPYRKPGAWPDADMLPLGQLALGKRDSRFTPDEQQTLMTLWAIARSPLIMGGDLRHLDTPTLRLLTNRDVIAVNQASTGNRPLAMPDGSRAWIARAGKGGASYLALFNLKDAPADIAVSAASAGLDPRRTMRDLWSGETFGPVAATVSRKLPAHGSCLLRIS